MLSFSKVSLNFGARTIFDEISFNVTSTDRLGLVGANGSGKTTLMRIIAGVMEPSSGTISRANYLTVGYLPQEEQVLVDRPLYDEVATVFAKVLDLQRQIEEASQKLQTLAHDSEEYLDLLHFIGAAELKLEDSQQGHIPALIERVLTGLGFSTSDFGRRTTEFSGGWKMRISLAKLLLQEPAFLLLDEPTNHLDLSSLCWLEQFLRSYRGAYLIISHDRAFLDALCHKTLALRRGNLDIYAGNYSFYLEADRIKQEQLLHEYQSQNRKVAQVERFIERFRYKASKARQVQSRIKALNKMELIEIEDESSAMSLSFPEPPPCGQVVLELKGVAKSYGNIAVFADVDLRMEKGERLAVVGNNGQGKSTLLRILAGEENFQEGERVVGHNVRLAYYSQSQADNLDMQKTVLETLEESAAIEDRPNLRGLLGAFLFHGDDVFKRVGVLSGGEKCRVALAKLLLQRANVLLMDEPTNHLDMASKEILQEALMDYKGSLVIVSHDRAFVDPLVNKVVDVAAGRVTQYWGNVSYYLEKQAEAKAAEGVEQKSAGRGSGEKPVKKVRQSQRERRQELGKVEKRIMALEAEIKGLEGEMQGEEFFKLGKAAADRVQVYEDKKRELAEEYGRWEELSDEG